MGPETPVVSEQPTTVSVLPEDVASTKQMVQEAQERAAKMPTETEIRQWRRRFVTKIHPTVTACGHKIDPARIPTNNCEDCWYAYFHEVANLEGLHAELRAVGSVGMKKTYGNKFIKKFTEFLRTELLMWNEQHPRTDGLSVPTEEGESSLVEIKNTVITNNDQETKVQPEVLPEEQKENN